MNITLHDQQAALGFLERQRTHIERQVNETLYPAVQYRELIPVDTSAPEWTAYVEYHSMDRVGVAKWLNGQADDVPKTDIELATNLAPVYMAGIGYGYGYEEINIARVLGRNLSADKATAARMAYEEFVDRVALLGDTAKNFSGLTNYPGVTAISAVTGAWDTATSDQIIADLNAAIMGQYQGTLFTVEADTILLPFLKYSRIANMPRSSQSDTSILSWYLRNNPYTTRTGQPLTIRSVRGLETAGAGATNRMVVYRRHPQVLKLHIPMPHRFLPVWQAGPLRWDVPGVFRMGGLEVRRPAEMRYIDGI